MTTIIVKNADFSGGKMIHYTPPIADASLCAWVGDEDSDAMLRNFGTGGDLEASGSPVSQDELFRRFNLNSYLTSDTYRTTNTTFLAVVRDAVALGTASSLGLAISSERNSTTDSGRRGAGLLRNYTGSTVAAHGLGTSGASATEVLGSLSVTATGAQFIAGVVYPHATTADRWEATVNRLTPTAGASSIAANLNATIAPTVDEADYPFRIGANYRSVGVNIDLAFVMVVPRKLTLAEMTTVYDSVKRRFTALGMSI